ncbi:MAG: DUF1294 domain-containing protein [Syntrophomonadaceae bacterium]
MFDSWHEIAVSVYLLTMNGLTLTAFAQDKRRAVRNTGRIRERTLLGMALAGGSLGGWAGMYIFRHKIRSPKFRWGMPAIITLQIILILCTIDCFSR